jgi:hypothetical protein
MVVKMDWKTIKCNHCESKKYCRRHSISKGSETCQVNKKLIPPRKKKEEISKESASSALLWSLTQNAKRDKE